MVLKQSISELKKEQKGKYPLCFKKIDNSLDYTVQKEIDSLYAEHIKKQLFYIFKN
jgi:hypothetical protein